MFVRLALKVVVQNDGDFVGVKLVYIGCVLAVAESDDFALCKWR